MDKQTDGWTNGQTNKQTDGPLPNLYKYNVYMVKFSRESSVMMC